MTFSEWLPFGSRYFIDSLHFNIVVAACGVPLILCRLFDGVLRPWPLVAVGGDSTMTSRGGRADFSPAERFLKIQIQSQSHTVTHVSRAVQNLAESSRLLNCLGDKGNV